jgi:SAM-dependent methyltransferase
MTLYDRIGVGYANRRRAEPRWAAIIEQALGDAATVLNVGAGAGSYEPAGRRVIAVEPSLEMIAQRPAGAAPVARGVAGALPFPVRSFDVALAVLTVHHWPDPARGLAEMRRVAGRQVVVTWEPEVSDERFWLVREYIAPDAGDIMAWDRIAALLTNVQTLPLPVPRDCADGVFGAYWRRPEAYLDPAVRASISALALADQRVVERAMGRLDADLRSGAWYDRHADLLALDEIDLGYRLLIGETDRA